MLTSESISMFMLTYIYILLFSPYQYACLFLKSMTMSLLKSLVKYMLIFTSMFMFSFIPLVFL